MMFRIVYTSASKTMMTERGLQQILRSARRNNAMNLVTGLLIYHDGCFFQVLEGPKEAVETCYAHITKDTRHSDCVTLARGTVVSRVFSEWWMSYRTHDDLVPSQRIQLVSLRQLANKAKTGQVVSDLKTNAILLAFLSGFRDLGLTG